MRLIRLSYLQVKKGDPNARSWVISFSNMFGRKKVLHYFDYYRHELPAKNDRKRL